MLQLENIWFRYHQAEWILKDCCLDLATGERILIRGANGCGKSTLLRLIAGLRKAQKGQCSHKHQHGVALMPQSAAIDWHLPISCKDIVAAGWRSKTPWWKPQGSGRTQAVRAALELVKLTNMAHKAPAELSGGQRQRLLIARTLVQGGKVLLLDEPLSGLDAGARQDLGKVLRDICEREGTSIIVASHEVEHFPLRFDRDLHFHQGGLVNTHDIHCEVVGDAH